MKRIKSFVNNQPVLYMIATPIGNLSELSPRFFDVLKDVEVIFCEDTRNTGFLLSRYDIHKTLISLREHNEASMSEKALQYLASGKNIAYMSDAGYPAISDPGKILVKIARENDYAVATISGPCAFINAIVSSSRETNHFYYYGFLDANKTKAKKELETLKNIKDTIIFYEAPHRLKKCLENIYEVFGDREITLARELTKLNEEYIEGKLSEILEIDENSLIGEFVILVEGNQNEEEYDEKEVIERAKYLLEKNIVTKDVADILSYEFNISKNDAYKLITDKLK